MKGHPMPEVTLDAARRFVDALPHSRALGMRLVAIDTGRAADTLELLKRVSNQF